MKKKSIKKIQAFFHKHIRVILLILFFSILITTQKRTFLNSDNPYITQVRHIVYSFIFSLDKDSLQASEPIKIKIGSYPTENLTVELINKNIEEKISPVVKQEGNFLEISPPEYLRPGSFEVTISENGSTFFSQDFSWGVLAVNTNKSIYKPNETANIAIAVLNEKGMMVCDADVILEIKVPGGKNEKLSTKDDTIRVNPECEIHDYTTRPDYETDFTVSKLGTYSVSLKAKTENGTYEINDSFVVSDETQFDIERITATRIYPKREYPVSLKITAKNGFSGKITETVPKDFIITQPTFSQPYEQVETHETTQVITWDVDLAKNETITLTYYYDAPDKSPQFFLLGPAMFKNRENWPVFQEARQWQIANDAATAGDYLIRRNDLETDSVTNTGNLDATWDTAVDSNGTSISYSAGTFTLAAGKYLVMYSELFYANDTTDNQRNEIQGRLVVGGTEGVIGAGQTFIRKASPSQSGVVAGVGILNIPSDSTSLVTRFYRTDSSSDAGGTTDRIPDYGGVSILALSDSWNYGRYSRSTTTTLPDTWGDVVWEDNDEQDTGFSRTNGEITISSAGRYLVTYSVPFSISSGSDRSEAISRITLNDVEVEGTEVSTYLRASQSTMDGVLSYSGIIDIGASDVLALETDITDGTSTFTVDADANIQIVQLPAGNETIILEATTGDMNPTTLTEFAWDTTAYIDEAGFTHTNATDSFFDVDVSDDYLFFSAQKTNNGGTRTYSSGGFTVNDVASNYALNGQYNRNSGADHAGYSVHSLITGLTAGDDISLVNQALATTGSQTADHAAMSGVRLGSIFAAAPTTVTLSGHAYQENETTAIDGSGTSKTVTLLVNGAATACSGGACTTEITTSDGAWSITDVTLASSDVVTVYLDDETEEATTVFITDGSAQTNVDLYQNSVIVRADAETMTNTALSTADGGDDDIKYVISTGNLTVDSGFELHVWTGDTFDPGGTVTTNSTGGDLHLDDLAIAYLDTATSTIGVDALVDTGATLNIDADTDIVGGDITMTGTGSTTTTTGTPTVTLSGSGTIGGGTGTASFYNLSLDTVGTTTLNSPLNIANDLVVGDATNAHTFDFETNDAAVDVNGDVTINANGTLSASSTAAFTVGTNWTNNGTFNEGTGTITFDSSAAALLDSGCTTASSCTAENFYNVTLAKATSTDTVTLSGSDLRVGGTLTLTTGTLVQGASSIQVEGTTAISVAPNGIFSNTSTGDISLGGSVSNTGSIIIQGNGSTCDDADSITITSTVAATQRSWTGIGSFAMNDISVQDQGGTATITVYSGTSVSGNDTNWTFSGCPAIWYDSAWLYRKKLTIDHALISGLSDISNFPVLVSFTDTDLSAAALSSGNDILFTSDDKTTKLSHEIESYDSGTGTIVAWVKLPSLSVTTDTDFYIYYGNSGATNQEDITNTWDSNYVLVQHLSQTTGTHFDSPSNNNDSTAITVTTQGSATGQINGTDDFNGSSNDITIADSPELDTISNFTVSAWIKDDNANLNHNYATILTKGDSDNTEDIPYRLLLGWDSLSFDTRPNWTESGISYDLNAAGYTVGEWIYVSGSYTSSGSTMALYVNGVRVVDPTSVSSPEAGTGTFNIGSRYDTQYWNGQIDEVHLSNIERSRSWIATEYNNQANPGIGSGKFIKTVGVEESTLTWYSSSWSNRKKLTLNATLVSGTTDLTNYPVLISFTDSDVQATALSSGDDLLFTASDGSTKLDHEIENYNSTTGEMQVWVRVPTLGGSTDTDIYLYYGNSGATNQENVTNTWDTNYIVVHHLEETTTGNTDFKDSTSNTNDSTVVTIDGAGSDPNAVGQIGGAVQFDGIDDEILIADDASHTPDDITIEAWVKVDSIPPLSTRWKYIQKDASTSPYFSYYTSIYGRGSGTADLNISYYDIDTTPAKGNSSQDDIISTSIWYNLVWTRSGDTNNLFINGVNRNEYEDSDVVDKALWDANGDLAIGSADGADYCDCFVDEVKISNSVRSTDWIATEYNNATNQGIGSTKFIKLLGDQEGEVPSSSPTNTQLMRHGGWFSAAGVRKFFSF